MTAKSPPVEQRTAGDFDGGGIVSREFVVFLLGLAWLVLFAVLFFSQSVGREQTPRLTLLLLLPELLAANFEPADNAGWRYLPQRFDLLLTAAVVIAAAWGLGRLLLRLIGVRLRALSAEGLAFTLGLGLSAWSLVTLGLGLAGMLSQGVFAVLAVFCLAGGAAADWGRKRAESAGITGEPGGVSRLRWGVVAVCSPFVLAMLLGSLLPTTDFDVKEYHLGGPKEFLQAGRVTFLPHNVYTSFPFLTEMLALSAMVLRGDWLRGAQAGQAVLMSYAIITAWGVFALARRLAGERAAWLAVLIALTTPWMYRISIIAYTEGALACYLVLSVLALVRWVACSRHTPYDDSVHQGDGSVPSPRPPPPLESFKRDAAPIAGEKENGWLWLTGVMAGSAAATKYPGVLSAVIPIGLAVLCVALRCRQSGRLNWRKGLIAAAVYSTGVLITFGPWLVKNLVETGNPVYPLLWSLIGGESFDAATNVRWKAAHAAPTYLFVQPSLILPDLLERMKDIALRSDWQSPLVCGLLPLSLLAWRRVRGLGWLWMYLVWLLLTWCWLTHRLDRFWVPMIPLLAVLAGIGLQCLLGTTGSAGEPTANMRPALLRFAVWSVVGLCVLFNLGFNTTGLAGFGGYLMEMDAARDQALGSSIRVCNAAKLGSDSKVLFVGEAAHFEAGFPYVYHTVFDDSFFEQWCSRPVNGTSKSEWPMRDTDEIRRIFAEQGITHVCVNWLEIVRYRLPGSYGYSDFVHPDRFDALLAAGLVERTPFVLPVDWDGLNPSWQQEIARWAPGLRVEYGGADAARAIEVFRVVDPPPTDKPPSAAR